MPLNAKDLALYNAIKESRPLKTQNALKDGANLFAEIDLEIAGQTRRTTLFGFALFSNCKTVIQTILDNRTSIDISGPFDIFASKNALSIHPINLLQFAYVYSTNSIIEALIAYANSNGKDANTISSILNKVFYRPGTTQLTTVASEALLTFSPHMVTNTKKVLSASIDNTSADKDITEWVWLGPEEHMKLAKAEHIELVADFSKKLESLLERGFNPNLTDCFGMNLAKLIRVIDKCSKDPELWETELAPKLVFCNMNKIGAARLNASGTDISIDVDLSNTRGAHTRRVTLTQDTKSLRTVYRLAMKARQQGSSFQGLYNDLHALPDQRLKDVQATLTSFPTVKTCFDTLQRRLEHTLTLECMASTGMISLNRSKLVQHEQGADLAISMIQTTVTALNVAAQFSPVPFVGILPLAVGSLVDLAEKTRAAVKSTGIFDATLGMDLKEIGIDVAMIVSAEAFITHKHAITTGVIASLVSDVLAQLKRLKDTEIIDQAHLVAFLAQTAITKLRATRAANVARPAQGSTALVPSFARLSDQDTEQEQLQRAAAPSYSSGGVTHALFGGNGSPKGSKHSGSGSSMTAHSPAHHSGSGSDGRQGSNSSPAPELARCCIVM